MADPINYAATFQGQGTPFDAALSGYKAGFQVQQAEQERNVQQQALLQQQQQMQQLAQARQEALDNPNPNTYAKLIMLDPKSQEAYKTAWGQQNEAQQQNTLNSAASWNTAITNGNPAAAISSIRDQAKSMGSDNPVGKQLSSLADIGEKNPALLGGMLQSFIAAHPKGEQYIKTLGAVGEEARKTQLQPYEVMKAAGTGAKEMAAGQVATATIPSSVQKTTLENKNIQSQIDNRAAQLNLDKDKLTTETQLKLTELNQKFGELPDDARKLVNDSAITAVSSEQSVNRYQGLASQLDKIDSWSGIGGNAAEWLKKVTGSQDAVTDLKKEYTRMAATGVMKLLPPGTASDKDVSFASEGVPNSSANPAEMASYLRGLSKLSAFDAVVNDAKAEWAGAVKHLGKTPKDIIIGDTKVPAGTTFNDFAKKYLSDKADKLNTAATLGTRNYMKWANGTPQEAVTPAPQNLPSTNFTPVPGTD